MDAIKIENLTFSYDQAEKPVLDNLSLTVKSGEFLAVVGRNASGKSTLARLITGLLTPNEGTIEVLGIVAKKPKELFEIRKKVGIVFQNPDNQMVASIVEDDIAFGPENLGVKREEIKERIDFALSAVGMQDFKKSSPTRLSGGQKQRIAIAGVLALKPKILVLDESTAMLDPQGRKEVLSVVEKLNKEQGVTVINITHYMDEVVKADKVYVINDGEIALSGTPAQIFERKEQIKAYGLELPLSTVIAQKLVDVGVPVNPKTLTEEELEKELCALLQKN